MQDLLYPIQQDRSIEIIDLLSAIPREDAEFIHQIYLEMAAAEKWIKEYLANPRPEPGNRGLVCPYVSSGIARAKIKLAYFLYDENSSLEGFVRQVESHGERFRELPYDPDEAVMIVLVNRRGGVASGALLVEAAQKQLKAEFISNHLMVGQFFPGGRTRGVQKNDITRFECPVASIGIRNIMPQDLVFAADTAKHRELYLKKHGIGSREELFELLESVGISGDAAVLSHADRFF